MFRTIWFHKHLVLELLVYDFVLNSKIHIVIIIIARIFIQDKALQRNSRC